MIPGHVATARALVGRPWRHRGRGPAWFDCLGVVVVALQANGIAVEDRQSYGRVPFNDELQRELRRQFGEPLNEPAIGRIAVFRGRGDPLHVGIFGDYPFGGLSLIHSSNEPVLGRVVEHRFAGSWLERYRFVEAYEVPCGA